MQPDTLFAYPAPELVRIDLKNKGPLAMKHAKKDYMFYAVRGELPLKETVLEKGLSLGLTEKSADTLSAQSFSSYSHGFIDFPFDLKVKSSNLNKIMPRAQSHAGQFYALAESLWHRPALYFGQRDEPSIVFLLRPGQRFPQGLDYSGYYIDTLLTERGFFHCFNIGAGFNIPVPKKERRLCDDDKDLMVRHLQSYDFIVADDSPYGTALISNLKGALPSGL